MVSTAEAGVQCDDLVDDGGKGTVAQFADKSTEYDVIFEADSEGYDDTE